MMSRELFLGLFFFIMIILFTGFASALCSEGQIDINSASTSELDELIWVGPATANKIIAARPFDSVDGLLDVSGIGEVKLGDIKAQGIACVGPEGTNAQKESEYEEGSVDKEKTTEDLSGEGEEPKQVAVNYREEEKREAWKTEPITLQTINLNPQTIKSEEKSEEREGNYALYGLVVFSIVLGALFAGKAARKRKYQSEFIENE